MHRCDCESLAVLAADWRREDAFGRRRSASARTYSICIAAAVSDRFLPGAAQCSSSAPVPDCRDCYRRASALAAVERVLLTDYIPKTLENLKRNVAQLEPAEAAKRCEVAALDWHQSAEVTAATLPADGSSNLILAADVVYEPTLAKPLLTTLARCSPTMVVLQTTSRCSRRSGAGLRGRCFRLSSPSAWRAASSKLRSAATRFGRREGGRVPLLLRGRRGGAACFAGAHDGWFAGGTDSSEWLGA